MNKARIAIVTLIALGFMGSSAQAAGCLKGAVVGGVAGHFAHHHAVIGAIAGCAIGHHMAAERKKRERVQARLQLQNHQGHQ